MRVPRFLSAQRCAVPGVPPSSSTAAASAQPYEPGHAPVTAGHPVELVVWNRPIVTLRARVGETTPAERVERAAERIENIPDEELTEAPEAIPASVGALKGLMIFVGTRQVFYILQEDIDPETTETLAEPREEDRTEAGRGAGRARRPTQPPTALRGLGLSAVATLLFVLAVWALLRFERWTEPRLAAAAERRGRRAARQVSDRRADHPSSGPVGAWATGLFLAYLWLAYVLSQFPYTQPWGEALGGCAPAGLEGAGEHRRFDSRPGHRRHHPPHRAHDRAPAAHVFIGVETGRLSLFGLQQETAGDPPHLDRAGLAVRHHRRLSYIPAPRPTPSAASASSSASCSRSARPVW
jgi:hypothetical protein